MRQGGKGRDVRAWWRRKIKGKRKEGRKGKKREGREWEGSERKEGSNFAPLQKFLQAPIAHSLIPRRASGSLATNGAL